MTRISSLPCLLTDPHFFSYSSPTEEEIHTYCVHSDGSEVIDSLAAVLSCEERERAARFHFERDRRSFVVGRGLLRTILGHHLDIAPSQLVFGYGDKGKPHLQGDGSGIEFNISHSGGTVLLGFTRGCAIGVDVERIRPTSYDQIARRFFSAKEYAKIRGLPEGDRLRAFFVCWTRKEAFIKACGRGLSYPLERFEMALEPGEPPALLGVEGDPMEARRWSIMDVELSDGFVAACAVRGKRRHVPRIVGERP